VPCTATGRRLISSTRSADSASELVGEAVRVVDQRGHLLRQTCLAGALADRVVGQSQQPPALAVHADDPAGTVQEHHALVHRGEHGVVVGEELRQLSRPHAQRLPAHPAGNQQ